MLAPYGDRGRTGAVSGTGSEPASGSPYAEGGEALPTSLGEALDALAGDDVLVRAFTAQVTDWFTRIKRAEIARHATADDSAAWQAREYFSRF